ncbi:MAG: hypothetical protein KDN18_18955 [Verrucomicrobiae bacterium]|nr:hypothetical protein [Verrucomicrobiae bacterium]
MNTDDFSRTDLIDSLGPFLSGPGVLGCALLWLITIKLRDRFPGARSLLSLLGFLFASAATWLAFQFLGAFFALATSWSLFAISILGGASAEAIVWIYGFEKSLVSPARGRLLLGMRLGALVILLLILVQPVRSFIEEREISREVAVLIDDSDSMRLSDQRLTPSQKLDRAALLGVTGLGKRPAIATIGRKAAALDAALALEVNALRSAPDLTTGLEGRAAQLPEVFRTLESERTSLTEMITEALAANLPGEVKGKLDDYLKRTRDGLARILPLATKALESGSGEDLVKQLEVARNELAPLVQTIANTASKADEAFYNNLDDPTKKFVDEAATTPREELARRVLSAPVPATDLETPQEGQGVDATLLGRLKERYNLRFYRFARDVTQVSDPLADEESAEIGAKPENAQTDLTGALEHVLDNTSPESLAGVLLLGDGRHNGAALPEDSLRQLAVRNAPLSAVPLGADLGPVDISLLSLNAPESIYLDDRVVITATAKLDGFLGEKVVAELVSGDRVIDTVTIDVTDVSFRTEIHFVDKPESKGIQDYQVRLKPDEREIFKENNSWNFKVAVTDDRTNVLLVDGYPRWEFRYLRNLFYGRDKSVHLQYVLLNPDQIYRGPQPPTVYASASRPFGEAEATNLPQINSEWQRFDVIILGDIPPNALSARDLAAIEEAVTKRGALLVCVAGPRYMPHGHDSRVLRDLLPVTYTPGTATRYETPEEAYRIHLTATGREHPVTSQSTSRALNEELWATFPPMRWRYSGSQLKDTAEVLAYAHPVGSAPTASGFTPDGSPGSVEAAIQQLANQKNVEAENSVVTTIRAGLGKVLLLHFDQTWRFRYGVGDTYHHRFWGQVTRWGAGPNLRSGNDFVRVGTDRLSYTPNDSIEVTAKVLDPERRPVTDAGVEVEIWKDGERLRTQRLSYRSDSSGLYETSLAGLDDEGEYELKLVGDEVDTALAAVPDGPKEISTELLVVTTRNPIELAELTADRNFLNRATTLTGGKLTELDDLASLVNSFGAPKEVLKERRNITLWDKWPLLLAFFGLLTTEWVLRRRSGLV